MRLGITRPGQAGRGGHHLSTRRVSVAAAATLLTFAVAADALAAHPKPGNKYSGFTSEPAVAGFHAPVSFRVSSNGTALISFRYSTVGCFGGGGFRGDPFTLKDTIQFVGRVKVGQTGSFSVTGARSTFVVQGQKTVTATSITGRFKTAKLATGKISYKQTFSDPQVAGSTCGPMSFTFSAKLR
jgi:hypothetical protein